MRDPSSKIGATFPGSPIAIRIMKAPCGRGNGTGLVEGRADRLAEGRADRLTDRLVEGFAHWFAHLSRSLAGTR